ncbi:hypothetical protein [Brevibacterium sp. UCMA 11754]|uniref:hypothetical protein n=1 Tax=Brevibacterium sp. UCMA 11754 TaxID=2749198 RepID=UPI001F2FC586|nr:hypothetical protein [Brevibacterium sp. UCMA 11754]MCF2572026.1 hypothetical protein [Brevibacterium sp. UCMA 11754]
MQISDAGGAYLAPAYVDIHCHGAGGSSAEDGEVGLSEVLAVHHRHGTRALALSYVSDTVEGLCHSLTAGAGLCRDTPAVLGLHAEGPFLSPDFKGAHAPEVLTAPTPRRSNRSLGLLTERWPRSRSPPNCPVRSTRSHGSPRRG